MNQIEVQIMGQNYRLGCPPDGEARLREAVIKVDAAMCKIRDAGKVKARDRIAVLASLNLAFDESDPKQATKNKPNADDLAGEGARSSEAPDPALSALIQRLDIALGEDGRLI